MSKAPDVLHNRTGTHTHSITLGQMPGSRYSRRVLLVPMVDDGSYFMMMMR